MAIEARVFARERLRFLLGSAVDRAMIRGLTQLVIGRRRHIQSTLGRMGRIFVCYLACILCLSIGLDVPAASEERPIKSVRISQIFPAGMENRFNDAGIALQYNLICLGTVCLDKIPIMIGTTIYNYDAVVVITYDYERAIYISLNLRPTQSGCDPRCKVPTLNSAWASVPWTRQAHTTIPIKQYGNSHPNDATGTTDDPVYLADMDPIAYLDVSIEWQ